jgi:DNA-binding response OmpR family regulator
MKNNEKPVILYVEDDETLGFITKDNLEQVGFEVILYQDGEGAFKDFDPGKFDLCILDIMLPKLDGLTLAKKIRDMDEQIPIIFLTAKSFLEDRITGLKSGADDYLTKPFSIDELVLKIEVFLKRSRVYGSVDNTSDEKLMVGKFKLDYDNLELIGEVQSQKLTTKEAALLRLFFQNKNMVIQRGAILKTIWGEDDYFSGRSLDVFISRLRKYLKADNLISIENIHGVGFRLKEEYESRGS